MFKISEQGIGNLAVSLALFQEEVDNPSNTSVNPQFRSKYAPLEVVINTVKPILAKYGLSVIQSTGGSVEQESVSITTMLIHKSGEWIQTDELPLPAYQQKSGGVKDFNAQGAGSAITYGRRYQLSAVLGISSEDDDDANAVSQGGGSKATQPKSQTQPSGGMSDADKEAKKAEALAKAQAKKAETEAKKQQTSQPEPQQDTSFDPAETEPSQPTEGSELINEAQKKAIGNLLNVLSKKKKDTFDKDVFLATVFADYGVGALDNLTSEQAKEVMTKINAEMRS